MDVLEKFLYSIAYKFPKGYPDMKNEQDILILENEIKKLGIEVSLEETKLTPSELSKDATFGGGRKVSRIEILVNKISNDEPLELDKGGLFTVTDKKDVLAQLQGKIKIDKAITLGVDEDGKTITTSDLKKTADFGGGGGM